MTLKTVFISFWLFAFSFWLLAFSPSPAWAVLSPGTPQPPQTRDEGIPVKSYYFEPSKTEFEADLFGQPNNINKAQYDLTTGVNGLWTIAYFVNGLNKETSQKYGVYRPGAIQIASSMTTTLIGNPPISTPTYLADLGSSLGLAKPAYAQTGTGWTTLQAVLKIWKVFRNLAYLVFVLIFIAVGFMIMFRTKINPQTIISVEAAIPNLIITLIIITFSYAIASLMIDLIWVTIYLAINIFSSYGIVGVGNAKSYVETSLLTKGVIGIGHADVFSGAGSIVGAAAQSLGEITVDALWGPGKDGTITSLVSGGVTGLFYVIISIALLFSLIKLFFQLLMSYIGLIMSVIFAPFQLLGNAFPGSNALTGWLKGMLANVLVFPATAVMFMLAAALVGSADWGAGTDLGFKGTEPGGGGVPLLGMKSVDTVKGLIGLGMMMMLPKVVEMIKASLKVEKGAVSPAGALAPMVGVMGMPGGAVGQVTQLLTAQHYFRQALPKRRGGEGGPATDVHPNTAGE